MVFQQVRDDIHAVQPHSAEPRQMVQPDVLQLQAGPGDIEQRGDPTLQRDGHVAQAHGPVALVQEGLRDDPHWVGEVHEPCVARAS